MKLLWSWCCHNVTVSSGGGNCSKVGGLFKRTHLYGEKLHSYGVTVKTGGLSPPIPPPMAGDVKMKVVYPDNYPPECGEY